MAAIETRELTEQEATSVLETLGDTPAHGIFVDDQLVAVTPTYGANNASVIVSALIVADDTDRLDDHPFT